jgi:hypothetical protein
MLPIMSLVGNLGRCRTIDQLAREKAIEGIDFGLDLWYHSSIGHGSIVVSSQSSRH